MKASALSRVLEDPSVGIEERVLHTGQHYSHDMAGRFVRELNLPAAHHVLNVSNEPAVRMGQMMEGVMSAIAQDAPDAVILYGDTDSTLAGAWAANRTGTPVVHIEAGLRSFDRSMPEEINRILTDALSDVLFCPSQSAVDLLAKEGIVSGARDGLLVEVSGDLMLDTARHFGGQPKPVAAEADRVLLTLHRPSNVDDPERLKLWIESAGVAAQKRGWRVHFPVHPRTALVAERIYGEAWREHLASLGIDAQEPASYLQVLQWLQKVRQVWTDSGGLQKEAFFMGRPAMVLRAASEWTELMDHGVALLCAQPTDVEATVAALESAYGRMDFSVPLYGDGQAALHIAHTLRTWLNR
jgi:UDP-GlcNAc3NAcA epimerase